MLRNSATKPAAKFQTKKSAIQLNFFCINLSSFNKVFDLFSHRLTRTAVADHGQLKVNVKRIIATCLCIVVDFAVLEDSKDNGKLIANLIRINFNQQSVSNWTISLNDVQKCNIFFHL